MLDVKKKRLLFLSVSLLMLLALSGCNKVSKSQYEQTISGIYSQSGLEGEIAVEYVKGEGYLYATPNTRVVFDYTEIVKGRAVTVSNTMFFEHNTDTFQGETAAIGAEDLFEFGIYSGIIQSFAFQEEALDFAKVIEQELTKQIEIEDFKLKEVAPYLLTFPSVDVSEEMGSFEDNLALYKEEVTKNQQANRPFSGYYDIDVKKYMACGLVITEITYENHAEGSTKESIDRLKADIYRRLSTLEVSDFYDGIYRLSFDTVAEDSTSVGDWGVFTFHVKDKKLGAVIHER